MRFDRPASSTYSPTSEMFMGLYGSGDSYGDIGTDVVTLGNYSVPDYAFAVLTKETGTIPVSLSFLVYVSRSCRFTSSLAIVVL